MIQFGLDRLSGLGALVARLRGARVGLLAHAASVDRRLVHAATILDEIGARPQLLFGPEHGFAAAAQDMAQVGHARDRATGARIVSLYGETLDDLVPSGADLAEIDMLVIDLADVGSRYYTFVWTALLAVRACAAAGVHAVVVDRPNPIGGVMVEGRSQAPGFTSFVGWERVPIRHALTLGELVALFAARDGLTLGPEGALGLVPVRGWARAELATGWDRPFVMPSPNMPTCDTALVYPGACLLEGTNLSEGRGTTRPFELCGAPWLDGAQLARDLAELGQEGYIARPVMFQPTFHKHAGEACGGVQVHVTDPKTFLPVATYVALIACARRQEPERFRFRTERYEYVDDVPAFDLLTGSAEARIAIEEDADPRELGDALSTPDPGWGSAMAEAAEAASRASW